MKYKFLSKYRVFKRKTQDASNRAHISPIKALYHWTDVVIGYLESSEIKYMLKCYIYLSWLWKEVFVTLKSKIT